MKGIVTSVATATLMVLGLSACSHTNPAQSGTQIQPGQQNVAGTGGTSKPGVPGLPGSKSGPAVTSSGTSAPAPEATSQDESGVRGLPGNKSGSAANALGSPSVAGPKQ
jgi:hypothetical protein